MDAFDIQSLELFLLYHGYLIFVTHYSLNGSVFILLYIFDDYILQGYVFTNNYKYITKWLTKLSVKISDNICIFVLPRL